ncbi:jg10722 [Pararge aegeria aegeria]|uniref:Jg10722 protein n=1 Tax=Pararge aegeria aegeria TaxID=348720 RepID=A0A8S4RGP4_9NEOP|nr:jg10722 [Pararge aegeria aegeria]
MRGAHSSENRWAFGPQGDGIETSNRQTQRPTSWTSNESLRAAGSKRLRIFEVPTKDLWPAVDNQLKKKVEVMMMINIVLIFITRS